MCVRVCVCTLFAMCMLGLYVCISFSFVLHMLRVVGSSGCRTIIVLQFMNNQLMPASRVCIVNLPRTMLLSCNFRFIDIHLVSIVIHEVAMNHCKSVCMYRLFRDFGDRAERGMNWGCNRDWGVGLGEK